MRYGRYALSALSIIDFGLSVNESRLSRRSRSRERLYFRSWRSFACFVVPLREEEGRMLETTLAQLRFAASLVFGMRFSPRSLEQLVDSLRDPLHAFGTIDSEQEIILADP